MHQSNDADAVLPREVRRTLELLATGLSTGEVAARVGCPPDVVRGHLARAILELGVASKLEAIIEAARLGLISLDHSE
jgi:DNA-binding CsgD family transcriptional regulator